MHFEIDPIGCVCALVVLAFTGGLGHLMGQRYERAKEPPTLGPAVLKEDVAKMCRAHMKCKRTGLVGREMCPTAEATFRRRHHAQLVEWQGRLYWRVAAQP